MVGQKMKKLSRVSRRQFAGFEEHPREEEEPEGESNRYLVMNNNNNFNFDS